jgi:hypothetical protein
MQKWVELYIGWSCTLGGVVSLARFLLVCRTTFGGVVITCWFVVQHWVELCLWVITSVLCRDISLELQCFHVI